MDFYFQENLFWKASKGLFVNAVILKPKTFGGKAHFR